MRCMKRTVLCVVVVVLWQVAAGSLSTAQEIAVQTSALQSGLVAGLAAVDITPSYPVRPNGFGGRTKESAGVRQTLWAKAIAIGSAAAATSSPVPADTVVVITVDGLGIPESLTERVAVRLVAHGIDRPRLAILASHTHSGPMIRDCANTLFGQPIPADHWERILRYSDQLERCLEEVAVAALADLQPAQLAFGIGRLGFAFNRRTAGGPVDHDLPLLSVRAPDGTLRGLFTTYACHAVTLSDDFLSGDWPGYAMVHLERRHPGCRALVSIGCGADSNPRGGVLGADWQSADILGRELADEIDRLLATELRPLTMPPRSAIERVNLPLAPLPSRDAWNQRATQPGAVGHHARTQLARLDGGQALATEISYPIQSMLFGDQLAWIFLPGEVVVDYARRLKRELDGGRTWIHAYANACPGYVPSARILREGGYEGGDATIYYDIPAPYAPGLEETIVAAVHRQAESEFLAVTDGVGTGGIAPLPPLEALATLRTPPGFRVELVAAEPLIESPVAVAFGPDGRTWVAEMADYPQGSPDGKPGGRVRCLHDDDGDGLPERSSLFLEGIPFPTGVTAWRGGVLVCAAPDVLFATDTDGDGRADRVEKLLSGFATHNFQARVNSLEYGLDGWLEGACGLFGGAIESTRSGHTTHLGQRDFRFQPDSGAFEAASGATQQGRVRNDSGDWFGCTNSMPCIHYPLADHWLRRNPHLIPSRTSVAITSLPGPGQLFPLSNQVLFALSGAPGRATAACGIGIYRDTLLVQDGTPLTGNVFTCEPVNNLVHRQLLVPDGATFTSTRAAGEAESEFLASSDPWFRPVQARTGPDGGLWIVDMYRYVIEHPIWIPAETLATLDPRAGAEKGRIYRVVPTTTPPRTVPRLDRLQGALLAAAMETPNGTVRDLVGELIRWRNDQEAIPALEHLALRSPRPEVRLQAMSTAATLRPPTEDFLARVLADPDALVRRHAVRIAEPSLATSDKVAAAVAGLAADPDAMVRMQVAATAASLPEELGAGVILELFTSAGADEILAAAIESSLTVSHAKGVMALLAGLPGGGPDRLVAAVAQVADRQTLSQMVALAATAAADSPSPRTLTRLAAVLDACSARDDLPAPASNAVFQSPTLQALWGPLAAQASLVAISEDDPEPLRIAAVRLVAHGPRMGTEHCGLLVALLAPRSPPGLQAAALESLRRDPRAGVAEALLAAWPTLAPRARREALGMLLERTSWSGTLLDAVESGTVSRAELDLATQQALLEHPQESIRSRAATVLQPPSIADRDETMLRYRAAIGPGSDDGSQVFVRHCAACHRLQGIGHSIGPDIASFAGKPVEALLTAVLDPHRAVDPRYQAYVIELEDGRSLTGTIVDETATSLTVLAAEGKQDAVLRREIAALRGTGRSLMPEGFERQITPAAMNDFWLWLASQRPPAKSLPGNTPQTLVVATEGLVVLPAAAAEIRGGEIVFETEFQNIGHWHDPQDTVRWQLQLEGERDVEVWAELSCDPGSAGNRLRLEGADPTLTATVASTGAWSRYELVRLGSVRLSAGAQQLVVRADCERVPGEAGMAPLRGALADLRALHLVPHGEAPEALGNMLPPPPLPAALPSPAEIARSLLDESRDTAAREGVIAAWLQTDGNADDLIRLMAAGLPADSPGSAEEYRRIPWIWRVAIAVGRRGDREQLGRVLAAALPRADADPAGLTHWQAVVIGGGLVNGLSLEGTWPGAELATVIRNEQSLQTRWSAALELATAMADDPTVPDGTRYDCLRMVALGDPVVSVAKLATFLAPGVSAELQMGAVSGLADIPDDSATPLLVEALPRLFESNRELAIKALVRSERRCLALLDAIATGNLPETLAHHPRILELVDHPSAAVRAAARQLLGAGGMPREAPPQ
ncbi:MAG: dehydrogenase [Planctomycetota bacterium]|nr:MAG: dehydrogenase [Planctomycetota bacterium]